MRDSEVKVGMHIYGIGRFDVSNPQTQTDFFGVNIE
jgi:hypothetical protein